MAAVLGYPDDPLHWNETVGMADLARQLEYDWERDTPGMYGDTSGGVGWANVAPAASSMFPRDWLITMASHWLDNPVSRGTFLH